MYKATVLLAFLMLMTTLTQAQTILKNVLIANEGNFGSGNATITVYDYQTKTATDGVFFHANGISLGDVVQSITEINNELYVVVNNSQKIVILNPDTYQQTGQITLGTGASPREILPINDEKAYITDLYSNQILVADLVTKNVLSEPINVGQNPDQMLKAGEYVFVANNGFGADSTIFKVDISTDAVIDTITVSRGPASMVVDSDGMLWVVCTGYPGDYDDTWRLIPGTSRPGGVHGINIESGELIASIEIESAGNDMAINPNNDDLYINSGGIRVVHLKNLELVSDTLIQGNFYSINYDNVNRHIYASDAKSFSSAGEVRYYTEEGTLVNSFTTGIVPGDIHFDYEITTSIADEGLSNVENFELFQNYPNPFNPSTVIKFSIPQAGLVRLSVFNAAGQNIAKLVNETLSAGSHSVTFEATSFSSGVYFYHLETEQGFITKKMILIK